MLHRVIDDVLVMCELKPEQWHAIITQYIREIVDVVKPDVVNGDSIDILSYVKIKKVPGGVPSDTLMVNGVACTGHVAHKGMRCDITNANVLLLDCALEYERVTSRACNMNVCSCIVIIKVRILWIKNKHCQTS